MGNERRNKGKSLKMLQQKGSDLFRLDKRVALITGATGHLGRFMSEALCEAGCHVILGGRSNSKLAVFAEELRSKQYFVSTALFDVTDYNKFELILNEIDNTHARLDIIVNNAHEYSGLTGNVKTMNFKKFNHSYDICVTATFHMVQLAKCLLKKTAARSVGGASIINIASMYGMVSSDPNIYGDTELDDPAYYGSAKAGLIQLTRYLACRLAAYKIRVNAISPGPFPPDSVKEKHPSLIVELCKKNPMQRTGAAWELKGPLLFLASDASSYVTGINLPVDGGWTSW